MRLMQNNDNREPENNGAQFIRPLRNCHCNNVIFGNEVG